LRIKIKKPSFEERIGMDFTEQPICNKCKHRSRSIYCAAYPEGIPRSILLNEQDHTKPINGDHGIQFEAIEED
jgi:hypothetical protein